MFPDDIQKMREIYKLHHTSRILPHDQNTSGFYLALLRKKSHISYNSKLKNIIQENKVEELPKSLHIESIMATEDSKLNKSETESLEEEKENYSQIEKNSQNQLVVIPKPIKEKSEGGYVKGKGPRPKKETWISFDSHEWDWIKNFYGINEEVIKPLLICQHQGDKKVLLITPGVKKLLDCDNKGEFNFIS